jgi:hypothetical protein
MASTFTRRLLHLAPVIAALVFLLTGASPARAEVACFQNLRSCYFRAAMAGTYWSMWSVGLDCELSFTDCARRAIIGR